MVIKLKDPKKEMPAVGVDVLALTDSGAIEAWVDKDGEWSFIALNIHGCGCCGRNNDKVLGWFEKPIFEY